MIDLLILWFLNCAVVSCLLFWWFESTLPVLATLLVRAVLRRLTSIPESMWELPDGMKCETMDIWTRQDWNKWRSQTLMPEYPKFAHMLGCSRCISFHMSYLSAIPLVVFGTQGWPPHLTILFGLVAAFGSSTVAHRLIPGPTSWTQK